MIEVNMRDFRALIQPVLPLVDNTGMTPLLESIQVQSFDGKLAALATDRYRIGFQLSDIPAGDVPPFLIPAKAAKLILKSFPGGRRFDAMLNIAIVDGKIIVSGTTGNEWCPSLRLEISQPEGAYPNILPLVQKSFHQPKIATTSVNMHMLAGFAAAAAGNYARVEIADKETDPVVIRMGETFIGILMPVRGAGVGDEQLTKVLPKPEAAAA